MRMTKISSSPIFIKWVFPLGILVFLSFFLVQGSRQEAAQGRSGVLFILGPMFMSAIFFTLWRQFASDLVSEIWLDEDSLVVRHKGREVRVKLDSVVNGCSPTCLIINSPGVRPFDCAPSSWWLIKCGNGRSGGSEGSFASYFLQCQS